MKKHHIEILIHIILWILLSIDTLNYALTEDEPVSAIISTTIMNIIIAIPFYFNYFFLADIIFVQKRYFKYILTVIVIITFTYFILKFTSSTWLLEDEDAFSSEISFITNLILVLGISNLFKGIWSWIKDQQKKAELEKEKLQTELNFLKLQINPHFLFNSLNNIYSLSYNKSDKAAPMISGLSKILRYMLYDCQETKVMLSKEVDLLKNFINMNVLKIGEERNIDFYTEGIENYHKIAPLILITFLENAFKHGNVFIDESGWINIEIMVHNNILTYEITNSKSDKNQTKIDSGIGLKNIQKQLEYYYENKHSLEINDTQDKYGVKLTLEI